MTGLQWAEKFRLGLPDVDGQHQRWFEVTGTYLGLLSRGQADATATQAALADAVAYARQHFHYEEALMRRVEFPAAALAAHVGEHEEFLARVLDLAQKAVERDPQAANDLAAFMCNWITRHIGRRDAQYAKHIRAREGTSKA